MNYKDLIASLKSAPIGDGDLVEQRLRVLSYQARILRGGFKAGILRAGLSLERGGRIGLYCFTGATLLVKFEGLFRLSGEELCRQWILQYPASARFL